LRAWQAARGRRHPDPIRRGFRRTVAAIAERGIQPAEVETYTNGMRKALFRAADGNEFGIGGPSAE